MRELVFDGLDGRFVDGNGSTVLDVGPWRLVSTQEASFMKGQMIWGSSNRTLDAGPEAASGWFEGTLLVTSVPYRVRLTLVLDWYINTVEPAEADQAIIQAVTG